MATNKDFHWVCNECDFPNLTGAVPEEDIKLGRHSCVMCGCVEMHKEEIGFKRCLLCEWSACENHNECLSSKNK